MRKRKKEKYCPILDKPCLKEDCAIYNTKLDNCDISILAFNLYKLSEAGNKLAEIYGE